MELPQRGTVPASGSWARRNSSVRRLASWRLVLDARTASSKPLRACMAWTTLSIWASAASGAETTMSGPSARISRLSSVTRVAISRIRSRLGSSPVISRSIHASTAGCYVLAPGGGRALVGTGVAVAIPEGYAGFIQPRSGLALRHGVTCLNTPGLIDAGYRDELRVLLVNTDPAAPYEVSRGDRIAQLVIQRVEQARFVTVAELPERERGTGGLGHSRRWERGRRAGRVPGGR